MLKILSALLMVALLSACTSSFTSVYDKPNGQVLVVDKEDWAGFKTYLSKVGSTYKGAFAMGVSNGHTVGYGYSDCPHDSCMTGKAFANEAMDLCHRNHSDCIMFAANRDILVNYKVDE